MKDRYVISECPRCNSLIIADSRFKTKTCSTCYAKIPLEDLKLFKTARDSREARAILSKAKAERGGLDQT